MLWKLAAHTLDLTRDALVMGIVNATPDSFSDGGRFLIANLAVEHALRMLDAGAGIIDIGGESTRPGATPVDVEEEKQRVLPVVERLLERAPGCVISIDTSKAAVADAALERGAAIINDITALRGDPAMAETAARHRAGVILMHMQGTPATMQIDPRYEDPVAEVTVFLRDRFAFAAQSGIDPAAIALDAGIGFGKTMAHNLALLRDQAKIAVGGRPMVAGISRKSFLGKIAGSEIMGDRLAPALALTALLRQRGSRVFRTHDVGPTVAALRAADALLSS